MNNPKQLSWQYAWNLIRSLRRENLHKPLTQGDIIRSYEDGWKEGRLEGLKEAEHIASIYHGTEVSKNIKRLRLKE